MRMNYRDEIRVICRMWMRPIAEQLELKIMESERHQTKQCCIKVYCTYGNNTPYWLALNTEKNIIVGTPEIKKEYNCKNQGGECDRNFIYFLSRKMEIEEE